MLGSTARALLARGSEPVLLIPPRFRGGGAVAALVRAGSDPAALRAAASALARAWEGEVLLFVERGGMDAVTAPGAGGGPAVRTLLRPAGDPASVAVALARRGVGTVVLDRRDPLLLQGRLDHFSSRFPGAILVLSS
jgi:hypothetical protein